MYFNDRIALGKMLAAELSDFRAKDTVILCLKEQSLMTCLSMAKELKAWVYPLITVPVYTEKSPYQPVGLFVQGGEFCLGPDVSSEEEAALATMVDSQRSTALETINAEEAKYGMKLDKHSMQARGVIIAGDVVTNPLEFMAALTLLNEVRPKRLAVAIGNASPKVADLARISAEKAVLLDVLGGVISDDDRYFERSDSYTPQQKQQLTQHIATYWQ